MKNLWNNVGNVQTHKYNCGFCDSLVASDKGWTAFSQGGTRLGDIRICPECNNPSYFNQYNYQFPGVTFGNSVKDIPEKNIELLFEEARKSTGVGAYTATVLSCRKLLMHIAVSKGAEQHKNFLYYVQYLADKNFIPPDAHDWVDHIRSKSNEANHEITIMGKDDAEELIAFSEMLLKVIFEFPAAIKRKKKS